MRLREGDKAMFANLPRRIIPLAVVAGSTLGLTGCFDLAQKVALHRDGSGAYAIAVSANGIVGRGLNKHDSDINIGNDNPRGVKTVTRHGDVTTETNEVAFRDLSDLHLGDETLSLHVIGRDGDGTRVAFHRSFQIDHARRDHEDDADRHFGHEVLQSMFGGHTYTFSVWLPGKIEHIAAVRLDGRTIAPTVWSDATGHTIVWNMPLPDMMLARQIDFDVAFAARGDFHDTRSQPNLSRHHRRHDDDDDGDNDESD